MPTCSQCLLTHETLNVRFGPDGVCNLCSSYDAHRDTLRDFDRLRPLLHERFERFRGRRRYDALVGLSGGKDSCYVAHQLVRTHGLKVLLMTYDNGFLTDHARTNIARIVEGLGQDHVMCTPSPDLHRAIYRSSLWLTGVPCVGCTLPGFLHAFKLAVDEEIPLLVHGRSRAQMFKTLAPGSTDPFLATLEGNFETYDPEGARARMMTMSTRLARMMRVFVPQRRFRPDLDARFSANVRKLAEMPEPPELVGYFLYEPYDEERVKAVLEEAIGWRRGGGHLMSHDDCSVHAAATYLHTLDYGYPILRPELSSMIREGDITREAAERRLDEETCAVELDERSMRALTAMTGWGSRRVQGCARRTGRVMRLVRAYVALRNRVRSPAQVGLLARRKG